MSMELLVEQNPWWSDKDLINQDPYIVTYDQSYVRWEPDLLRIIDFSKGVVYSLRGPRQVGKTTIIKLLIRKLIESGVDSKNILYFSCESIGSWEEFRDVLRLFMRISPGPRRYLFLDEVTAIEEWSRPVKYLYDIGVLRNNFILASGSHAIDLLKGVERLVGRRGKYEGSPDFVLLPMTFGDYIRAVDPKLYNKLIHGNILENLMIHHKNIMHHYWNYLRAGGFPQVQDSLLKHKTIEYHVIREFVNYIRQDIARSGMSLNLVMSLLRKMIMIFPGIVSWRAIASELGFSHVIVSNYAEKLRALFLVEYLYPPKIETGTLVPNFKKDKKIIFLDPFMLYAIYYWLYGVSIISRIWDKWVYDTQNRGKLMETLILRHLIYWIYGHFMHEESLDKIFYYRKNDLEIDFIAVRNNEALIIESKRRKKLTRAIRIAENIVKPRKAIKILVTEEELELRREIIVLPLAYLLFMLSTRKNMTDMIIH